MASSAGSECVVAVEGPLYRLRLAACLSSEQPVRAAETWQVSAQDGSLSVQLAFYYFNFFLGRS